MKRKNHYETLGIEPSDPPGAVRSAYHELAKLHHPDRAGEEETGRFQQINEAYSVLSDPDARADYDREQRCVCGAPIAVEVEPLVPRPSAGRPWPQRPQRGGPPPEPLIPEAAPPGCPLRTRRPLVDDPVIALALALGLLRDDRW